MRSRLLSRPNWLAAGARIEAAQVAVRAPSGKPLVYAEVLESALPGASPTGGAGVDGR